MARGTLLGHLHAVHLGAAGFGDQDAEGMLEPLGNRAINGYTVNVQRDSAGWAESIVVCPQRYEIYKKPVMERVLLLEFDRSRLPTLILTSHGKLYENRTDGYCATKPPAPVSLLALEDRQQWSPIEHPPRLATRALPTVQVAGRLDPESAPIGSARINPE